MLRTQQGAAPSADASSEPVTVTSKAQSSTEATIAENLSDRKPFPRFVVHVERELVLDPFMQFWNIEQVDELARAASPEREHGSDMSTSSGADDGNPDRGRLHRAQHVAYLLSSLERLPPSFSALDASRPWLVYWTLNSLHLLGAEIGRELAARVGEFVLLCQSPDGGFCGGPGQMPHLAPTYAAICALAILGDPALFESINRVGLYRWLVSLRKPEGGLAMSVDGEADLRAAYCAMHVAYMCGVLTPALAEGVGPFIARCQSWDGGLSAVPGAEAHGGYSFCGLAALVLLGETHLVNLDRLLHWVAHRQMTVEGGFQGRTNKLVDGCYSFWQGAQFAILGALLAHPPSEPLGFGTYAAGQFKRGPVVTSTSGVPVAAVGDLLCHQWALMDYINFCCQDPRGGLRDKPGVGRDLYHSCYVLSGLAVAQHGLDELCVSPDEAHPLRDIDPVLAVNPEAARAMREFFT